MLLSWCIVWWFIDGRARCISLRGRSLGDVEQHLASVVGGDGANGTASLRRSSSSAGFTVSKSLVCLIKALLSVRIPSWCYGKGGQAIDLSDQAIDQAIRFVRYSTRCQDTLPMNEVFCLRY